MSREILLNQISKAADLIVRSRIFLDAWWLSKGEEGRQKHRNFWEEFWEFWRFNEEALLCAFTVHISALFDPPRKDTVNLRRLMNQLVGGFSKSALAPQFERALILAGKVVILRSNLWAHRSAKITYAEAFKRANVTADELRELTELALLVVNYMLLQKGHQEREFAILPISELRRLAGNSHEVTEE